MLDWFDDPEQRRRTGSILNKGEARNALARAIFFNRLGELLAHVAPLGWEHIGLTGDYLWADIDKPRERFRPLRLHQQGRDA